MVQKSFQRVVFSWPILGRSSKRDFSEIAKNAFFIGLSSRKILTPRAQKSRWKIKKSRQGVHKSGFYRFSIKLIKTKRIPQGVKKTLFLRHLGYRFKAYVRNNNLGLFREDFRLKIIRVQNVFINNLCQKNS